MRINEYKRHVARQPTPVAPPPRSAEAEVYVTYAQLGDHGVPRYSRVHIRRLIARGIFPQAVMLSPNRVAWRLSDLAAWKASRPYAPKPTAA